MPFPNALTSANLTTLRGTEYNAPLSLAYVPQVVIYQARALSGVVSGVFAQLDYTSVSVGAYTAIKPGQTVYLATTTSIRNPYAIGRARISADGTYVYIGEMAVTVQPNDYITVVNDYWLHEKLGRIADDGSSYTDWSLSYANMQPLIGNLQSGYVNDVASGAASFSFAPIAQGMAYTATSSFTWSWDVADGTITTGSSSTQNITASFPQGFRWVRVTLTDSNSVSNFMVFPVWVGQDYIIPNIEAPSITADTDGGYNATIRAWDFQGTNLLRSLPDNTYVVAYSNDRYGATTTPILTNIDFVGRLRQENSSTRGDAKLSVVQDGSFQIEGFGAQLNRLSAPQLSISHNTSPSVWGQINRPTPPRMIAHLCTRYNTLSNLVSLTFQMPFTFRGTTVNSSTTLTVATTNILSVGMAVSGTGIAANTTISSIDSATTVTLNNAATTSATNTLVFTPITNDNDFISQTVSMTETSAGASINQVAGFINAKANYAPSGELTVRRQAIYLDDSERNDLVTIVNFTTTDMLSFTIDRDYIPSVGRVFAGAERFNTTTLITRIFSGSAPPVARGNGEGSAQEDGQTLTADSTDDEAETELNIRVAALYAASQPTDKLDVVFWDGHRNLLNPTCHQWWSFTISATDNQRGLIYTSSQRWILISMSHDIDILTGSRVLRASFFLEPVVGTAQVQSAIVPDLIPPYLPVLDVLPPYPAFPPDALINYPTDTPTAAEKQMNAASAFAGYSPLPPDEAQQASEAYAPPGCHAYNIFFSNSSNVAGFVSSLGANYMITLKGDAQLASNGWIYTVDFTSGQNSFAITSPWGAWTFGTGYTTGDGVEPIRPAGIRSIIVNRTGITSATWTSVRITFDITKGTYTDTTPAAIIFLNGSIAASVLPGALTDGTNKTLVWSGSGAVTSMSIQIVTSYDHTLPYAYGGSALLKSVEITGTGTNPFTGASGGIVRGDAFYRGYNEEAGGIPQAHPTGEGYRLQNAAIGTIPPYSENHEYTLLWTGDGNQVLQRMLLSSYSGVQNVPLRSLICRI